MRKIIIAGNWKLNNTNKASIELVTLLKREVADVDEVDVVVCPVFTALADVSDVIGETGIGLGAQNIFWEDAGAFTGEVSGPMLREIGVKYVIIGHSERRQYFGETDETVNKRIRAALSSGLIPIVCVGETLGQREADETERVVQEQVDGALKGFSAEEVQGFILAYEPVWAIGTGKTATPDQAQAVHAFIRGRLKDLYDEPTAAAVRIQYGGSVKPDNAAELMSQTDIDGALVGGASLKSESFAAIVKHSCGVKS